MCANTSSRTPSKCFVVVMDYSHIKVSSYIMIHMLHCKTASANPKYLAPHLTCEALCKTASASCTFCPLEAIL